MRNKFLYLGIFFIIILLMANQMLGPGLIHELLGMLLLILVIFHISINRRWWQYIIPQLKTAPLKTLTTLGLTISIVLAIISGLIISRHLFFFKSLLSPNAGHAHHPPLFCILGTPIHRITYRCSRIYPHASI